MPSPSSMMSKIFVVVGFLSNFGGALIQKEPHVVKLQGHENSTQSSSKIHVSQLAKVKQIPPNPLEEDNATDAEYTGVSTNSAADGAAFVAALITNVATVVVCMVIFMVLRQRYPMMFCNNIDAGCAPITHLGGNAAAAKESLHERWGWWHAVMGWNIEEVIEKTGMDGAMLLEFCHLSMKIMLWIGVPMFFVIGPINCAFGGQPAWAIGDYLSSLSFGNVEVGSYLYWMHAFVVWYVVITTLLLIFGAQRRFLELRHRWLAAKPAVEANTIMLEGIPDDYRSDDALKKFFVSMFGDGSVKTAYVVKETTELKALVDAKNFADVQLQINTYKWKQAGGETDARPTSYRHGDLIDHYTAECERLPKEIKEMRTSILSKVGTVGGVNTWTGFVTFTERRFAIMASTQMFSYDLDEFSVEIPPEPASLIWSDLMQEPAAQQRYTALGYAGIVGLYFAYMPLVIEITQLAGAADMGPLQPIWDGFAPTMGLTLMVSFLPTMLLFILTSFFSLKAQVWAQKRLQSYYFTFQVVFVVLVTAIGGSVGEFTETIFADPLQLPVLLGDALPQATHFYMNFIVLQWVTHAMNFTRYVMVSKFKIFSELYDKEEDARAAAEPEDQDYYGMGSRSARFTINMIIGIVFSTMSPPIAVLTFFNFAICRVVYGYLIPFAETKKADLGGVFWVEQLKHLFVGLIIYCVCMCGVLGGRSPLIHGVSAGHITAPALIVVVLASQRFEKAFAWHALPLPKVCGASNKAKFEGHGYVQEELYPTSNV